MPTAITAATDIFRARSRDWWAYVALLSVTVSISAALFLAAPT